MISAVTERGALTRDVRRLARRAARLQQDVLDHLAHGQSREALTVLAELRELADEQRRAVVQLALYDGASWRQVAASLGLPTATAYRQFGPSA